jgi:surface protein
MEKLQKATALDLSNFKTSTTNSFSTMNEVLDSRGNISKGNTKGL